MVLPSRRQLIVNTARKYWWLNILLAMFILAALVLRYSEHVPFWDQWEMVPLFQKQTTDTLSFSDFWAQHNEHRILFPNLLTYLLAQLTMWDPYYETLLNVLMGFGITGFVIMLIRQTFSRANNWRIITSIFAAWLILSPMQWENWLWGWQIEWYLSILAVVGSIWLLGTQKINRITFVIGLFGAIVATYSLANGFVIWFVGLFLLLVRKFDWRFLLGWLTAGGVTLLAYYNGYVNPPYHPPKTIFLHQPLAFLEYIFSYLGSPLSFRQFLSPYVGVLMVILFLTSFSFIWYKRKKELITSLLPWLAFVMYAGLGAILTAVSRLGFGVSQSYASRYTTISMLFTLATFVLATQTLRIYFESKKSKIQLRSIAVPVLLVLFFVPMALTYIKGIRSMSRQSQHLKQARLCAKHATNKNDPCLGLLYPNNEIIWERLQYLRHKGWGGF